jgi:hypothetical protein
MPRKDRSRKLPTQRYVSDLVYDGKKNAFSDGYHFSWKLGDLLLSPSIMKPEDEMLG